MKKSIFLLALLLSALHFGQTLKVMTYNIRLSLASDKENSWENRKEEAMELINYYHPDLFGVHESVPQQMNDLQANLKNYNFVGVGRDEGKNVGEYSALFYDTEKLQVLDSGTFWLSDTPEIPSKGWDAAYNRICTYALFQIKEGGKKFWAFNVHFDHVGNVARENSSKLILEKITVLNPKNFPVVLTGDFNLTPEKNPIKLISKNFTDTYNNCAEEPYGPKGTFNAFDTNTIPTERIDYIFVKNLNCKKYRTIDDRRQNLLYPSDHFPIMVTLKFPK